MAEYRTSRAARLDLIAAYNQGADAFGVAQADVYLAELDRTFDVLADHPGLGRKRGDTDPPVHVHPFRSHVIVYAIEDKGVLILRVRHGRENWLSDPVGRQAADEEGEP